MPVTGDRQVVDAVVALVLELVQGGTFPDPERPLMITSCMDYRLLLGASRFMCACRALPWAHVSGPSAISYSERLSFALRSRWRNRTG